MPKPYEKSPPLVSRTRFEPAAKVALVYASLIAVSVQLLADALRARVPPLATDILPAVVYSESEAGLSALSVPALIDVPPVYVLVPVRVSCPGPVLVKLPAPAIVPS